MTHSNGAGDAAGSGGGVIIVDRGERRESERESDPFLVDECSVCELGG